jgi:hypothetical protein
VLPPKIGNAPPGISAALKDPQKFTSQKSCTTQIHTPPMAQFGVLLLVPLWDKIILRLKGFFGTQKPAFH